MILDLTSAPKALDYKPAAPLNGNSYGIATREHGDDFNTAHSVVMRRLYPIDRPKVPTGPWTPTCYRAETLLPSHAPDACQSAQVLCNLFEAQAPDRLVDLAVIVTLRFEAYALRHEAWEVHRAFAREYFVLERNLPVVLAMHVPQLSFRRYRPHSHLVVLSRRLLGSDFADFADDLFADDAHVKCAEAFADFADRSA